MNLTENEKEILSLFAEPLRGSIAALLENHRDILEIRLRANAPAVAVTQSKCRFISIDGELSQTPEKTAAVSMEYIRQLFLKLCHYSVYTCKDDLNDSFLTTACGNRVGIAGTAVVKNGAVTSVKDITSLNFRVARALTGSARNLLESIEQTSVTSVLIAGAPACGKTTLLRETCRLLSSGYRGRYRKCAVIDERGELAAMHGGQAGFDVGINTDVLSGFPKAKGILNAVRTLSPEFIFADEIGSEQEAKSVIEGLNCGVNFFVSLHAANLEQLERKPQFRILKEGGGIDCVVFLGTGTETGKILSVYTL